MFFNGWYYLAKNQRLSATTYCSSDKPRVRLEFNQQLVKWVQAIHNSPDTEDDKYFSTIHHFADQDDLFTHNWQQWYTSSVGNEEFGLSMVAPNYSPDEISQLTEAYQARNTVDMQMQKFWIMVELMQTFGLT